MLLKLTGLTHGSYPPLSFYSYLSSHSRSGLAHGSHPTILLSNPALKSHLYCYSHMGLAHGSHPTISWSGLSQGLTSLELYRQLPIILIHLPNLDPYQITRR